MVADTLPRYHPCTSNSLLATAVPGAVGSLARLGRYLGKLLRQGLAAPEPWSYAGGVMVMQVQGLTAP